VLLLLGLFSGMQGQFRMYAGNEKPFQTGEKLTFQVKFGFIVGGLVSMGMPGFSGFIAEFPIFMGAWKSAPAVAVISVLGIIVTTGYILLVIRRVFFGEIPAEFEESVKDVSLLDKLTIGLFCLFMIALGILPSLMVPMVDSGVNHILVLLGGR